MALERDLAFSVLPSPRAPDRQRPVTARAESCSLRGVPAGAQLAVELRSSPWCVQRSLPKCLTACWKLFVFLKQQTLFCGML